MAHQQQRDFCLGVKSLYPRAFSEVNALDVGSLDINGSNRYLFTGMYTGIDLALGKNVDAVSKGHEWNAHDGSYDTIITTECLEHDMFYHLTLKNIVRMLKCGGLFLFTCASTGRAEHGTRRTSVSDSPFTSTDSTEGWCDYYKNLTEKDIREALDVESIFSDYKFSSCTFPADLYFYGVKR